MDALYFRHQIYLPSLIASSEVESRRRGLTLMRLKIGMNYREVATLTPDAGDHRGSPLLCGACLAGAWSRPTRSRWGWVGVGGVSFHLQHLQHLQHRDSGYISFGRAYETAQFFRPHRDNCGDSSIAVTAPKRGTMHEGEQDRHHFPSCASAAGPGVKPCCEPVGGGSSSI